MTSEHQPLIVRSIARQQICRPVIFHENRDVIRRVTSRRHRDDVTGRGQTPAGKERPVRFGSEIERRRRLRPRPSACAVLIRTEPV